MGAILMNILEIKWQRLISEGQTCPRCSQTEKELEQAISFFETLGIKVVLKKKEIRISEFKKDTLSSNQIWINDHLLEYWIKGKTNQSPCCETCGSVECRTVNVNGKEYEIIPANLIISAGLKALRIK